MTTDFQRRSPADICHPEWGVRRPTEGRSEGDVMKVWPPGKRPPLGRLMKRRAHCFADLANWVLHDEKLLVETRFGGDVELYNAWRDRLWAEMQDSMRRPDRARRFVADEEYVVMTAFGGNWAQYRVCRDRLREELWQIMKVTDRR
jgi:hypothetical protein